MPYNQDNINRDLAENDSGSSEFQKKVVELCQKYVKQSAEAMSVFYDGWDNNDFIYRGYRIPDRDDKNSVKDGEPPKIIVPVTYAQIQTATSFLFATFSQKPNLFELTAGGPEDEKSVLAMETDLGYQMRQQQMMLKLYFFIIDAFKYGFGVFKVDWFEQTAKMRALVDVPVDLGLLGRLSGMLGIQSQPQFTKQEQLIDVLEYQGNRVTNVSPYNFYPDPNVPIAAFQTGKFVGHDIETSMSAVRAREGKDLFGTNKIPASLPPNDMKDRKRRSGRLFGIQGMSDKSITPGAGEASASSMNADACVLLEMEMVLIPKDATKEFGFDLGNEDYPMKFIAVIGNDRKLVQFKSSGYLHNKFGFCVAEYSPDHNAFYNPGAAETIHELQNIITFFLNSHVVNVKKIIQNRFIADESKVNLDDLRNNSMVIRLKQAGLPIERVIQQLETYDVTKQHVQDMSSLMSLIQVVTGINENALGQYSSGRRSASEARAVNAGSAARLKMHGQLLWMQGLEPLGRQLLSNTRQGRTKEVYEMIVGALALEAPFEQVIYANPMKIAGGYDFLPYDANLPSDKQFQASQLQELFGLLISNPNSIQLLQKDPTKLLKHITQLLGIKNLDDYSLQPTAPIGVPQVPQAQVVPDQQAVEMAQQAGAQPVAMQGEDVLNQLRNGA